METGVCAMCICDEASDSLPNRGQQANAPLDWKTNV